MTWMSSIHSFIHSVHSSVHSPIKLLHVLLLSHLELLILLFVCKLKQRFQYTIHYNWKNSEKIGQYDPILTYFLRVFPIIMYGILK